MTREETLTLDGTTYTTPLLLDQRHDASYVVDHPAVTTAYTVQVSNSNDDRINSSLDKWADYDQVTIPSKSSAETFGIELKALPFRRVRLKAVTTVGTGTARVEQVTKQR